MCTSRRLNDETCKLNCRDGKRRNARHVSNSRDTVSHLPNAQWNSFLSNVSRLYAFTNGRMTNGQITRDFLRRCSDLPRCFAYFFFFLLVTSRHERTRSHKLNDWENVSSLSYVYIKNFKLYPNGFEIGFISVLLEFEFKYFLSFNTARDTDCPIRRDLK